MAKDHTMTGLINNPDEHASDEPDLALV